MTEILVLLQNIAPCNLWHVDKQRTDDHVGNITLDRNRRKLPYHPTLISYAMALAVNPVNNFYKLVTEARV